MGGGGDEAAEGDVGENDAPHLIQGGGGEGRRNKSCVWGRRI
jgi:hypothetical protein